MLAHRPIDRPAAVTYLLFALGLVLLLAGGDLLVRGASKLSLSLGMSPLVVGLTVVAFGTSAPELGVTLQGALAGSADLAMGNVVGSNIFNVLFILGLSALITPLVVDRQIVRQEVPLMIAAGVVLLLMARDRVVGPGDGAVLVALLAGYVLLLWRQSRRASAEAAPDAAPSAPTENSWDRHWLVQVALIVAGLALLVLGARWLVDAAIAMARAIGISELVIGLTIVAGGTSLPEVAASVVAALRGQREMAVGNVVGSCIFNILCVAGLGALLAPGGLPVATALLRFDIPVMLGAAIACLPLFFTGHRLVRWEGALFLAYYAAYTVYLVLWAQDHDLLDTYRWAMTTVVIPLTVVTLGVFVVRHLRSAPAAAEPR